MNTVKFLSFAVALFIAQCLYSSTMYWTVYTEDGENNVSIVSDTEGNDWFSYNGYILQSAVLHYTGNESVALDTATKLEMADDRSVDVSSLTDYDGYSYYVELIGYESGYSGKTISVGVSETSKWSDLVKDGHVTTGMQTVSSAWTGGTYNVPEPSSALMMLLGAALMGLRRRKV